MAADSSIRVVGSARRTRWHRRLVISLFTLAVGAFVWSQLPSGAFSTDLSRIGTGRPAVVLTQDAHYVSGTEGMAWLSTVRDQHGAHVDFLVAHLGAPDARQFAARHGAADGTVLLFAGDGRRVGVLHQPQSVGELRDAIVKAFGLPG